VGIRNLAAIVNQSSYWYYRWENRIFAKKLERFDFIKLSQPAIRYLTPEFLWRNFLKSAKDLR